MDRQTAQRIKDFLEKRLAQIDDPRSIGGWCGAVVGRVGIEPTNSGLSPNARPTVVRWWAVLESNQRPAD
ncbi:hypothetical protein [Thermomonas sp.]|uniref:hypothetical protein n=1 Tax=Thermomonas sp. TaxID=1971895 RepID=UPI00391DE64E